MAGVEPRAVGLARPETSSHQPSQGRPLGRHRLLGQGARRKPDRAAAIGKTVEEVVVLAAAASQGQVEAQTARLDCVAADGQFVLAVFAVELVGPQPASVSSASEAAITTPTAWRNIRPERNETA